MLQRGTGRPAMVVEHQHVLERRVARVLPIAVDIRLYDLLNLPARQQGRRGSVIGAADQHLAGADGVALPEPAILVLLAIGLGAEGRIQVWDHPDPPAWCVGSGAGRAIGEDLRRGHRLMPWAERT